jgi:hypothetical protein
MSVQSSKFKVQIRGRLWAAEGARAIQQQGDLQDL